MVKTAYIYRSLAFFSLLIIVISCDHIVAPDEISGYELPAIELAISAEDMGILHSNVYSEREVFAEFSFDGCVYQSEISNHGQYNRRYPKKSYEIAFNDNNLFNGKPKIILSSQVRDPSMLHSELAFSIFRKYGMPVSETEYVTLYINNELQGLYYVIEPVNEAFLKKRGLPLGNLYKTVQTNARFSFSGGYDPREGFEKKIIKDDNYADLEMLIHILDSVPVDLLPERIEKVLNVESYLRYLAISVLICNWDGFNNNLYLYSNPATGKFEVIPWDMDHTFEYSTHINCTLNGANHLSMRLLEAPVYRARYKKLIRQMLDSVFFEGYYLPIIESIVSQIGFSYSRDPYLASGKLSLRNEAEKVERVIVERKRNLESELMEF